MHNCLLYTKQIRPGQYAPSGKYSAYRLLAEVFLSIRVTPLSITLRCLLNIFDIVITISASPATHHYGVHILNVYSAGIYLAHNVI